MSVWALLLIGTVLYPAEVARIAWEPASGPVALYSVHVSDGRIVQVLGTQAPVPCWIETEFTVTVAAMDVNGNLGPFSEPSEAFRCTSLALDTNRDGMVGISDLGAWLAAYDYATGLVIWTPPDP